MSDNSKRISFGGKTYFQLGLEGIVPSDGSVYGLVAGEHPQTARLIPLNGDSPVDAYTRRQADDKFLTQDKADTRYATKSELEIVDEEGHYGVRGDYSTHYGITKVTNGLVTNALGTKRIVIKGGLTLCIPGKATKSVNASDITYDVKTNSRATVFLFDSGIKEAEEVFWQELQPVPTKTNAAWWNPKLEEWKYYDGAVWTKEIGTPVVTCIVDGPNIVRMDFIGFRVLDGEEFMTKESFESFLSGSNFNRANQLVKLEPDGSMPAIDCSNVKVEMGDTTVITKVLHEAITELDITKADVADIPKNDEILSGEKIQFADIPESVADIDALRANINALLAVLRQRGIIS